MPLSLKKGNKTQSKQTKKGSECVSLSHLCGKFPPPSPPLLNFLQDNSTFLVYTSLTFIRSLPFYSLTWTILSKGYFLGL